MIYDVIVIGGGAAGFFGAIQVAEINPTVKILLVEKTTKLLSKVKVSGGGRCNVTHQCFDPFELARHYPRGTKPLKHVFKNFHAEHTVTWFANKGVILKAEEDGRMFPVTDNSQTIIDCFLEAAKKLRIKIETGLEVVKVINEGDRFSIETNLKETLYARKILIATGGSPQPHAYRWIVELGHTIREPIPSLFTFNDSEKYFKELMGVSVNNAEVRIAGTKFRQQGPVLITHWGLSGPAIIKLSAWAAEYLKEVNYSFTALVSWIGSQKEELIRPQLVEMKISRAKQKVLTNPLYGLPQRLWQALCLLAEIPEGTVWSEMPHRNLNKLLEALLRCPFTIKGKTTFKEEFVTCGGVVLNEISLETMESNVVKNIFFAGEVLHVDGETGGFNFQSAWSTAYVAARAIAKN